MYRGSRDVGSGLSHSTTSRGAKPFTWLTFYFPLPPHLNPRLTTYLSRRTCASFLSVPPEYLTGTSVLLVTLIEILLIRREIKNPRQRAPSPLTSTPLAHES